MGIFSVIWLAIVVIAVVVSWLSVTIIVVVMVVRWLSIIKNIRAWFEIIVNIMVTLSLTIVMTLFIVFPSSVVTITIGRLSVVAITILSVVNTGISITRLFVIGPLLVVNARNLTARRLGALERWLRLALAREVDGKRSERHVGLAVLKV